MRTSIRGFVVVLIMFVIGLGAAKPRGESVFLFENRKVEIAVPEGLGFSSSKDELGMMTVQVADQKESISVHIVFVPDPENRFAAARDRKEKLVELFQGYVGSSSEKAMEFEELEPGVGAGTYCVFTDAALVGKTKLPPGEFIHFTSGIKAWPGVVAVFRVFTNDTTSKDYKAAMAMLRDSVHERRVPLR